MNDKFDINKYLEYKVKSFNNSDICKKLGITEQGYYKFIKYNNFKTMSDDMFKDILINHPVVQNHINKIKNERA